MSSKPLRPPWEALLVVGVVSFSTLAAEVALTRIFSALFRAPYVFLIVSGAIGGLGLGGLLAQGLRPREAALRSWIVALAVALSAALAAPVVLLLISPWGRDLVARAETALVIAIPMATFCVAGLLLSLVFRHYAPAGGLLYFVDLGAAALAAPAAVLLLDRLGGIDTPLALAALAALAAVPPAIAARRLVPVALALACLAASGTLLLTNVRSRWIDLPRLSMPADAVDDPTHPWHMVTKPLFAELASPFTEAQIVRTDWTAVSRTDVVRDPQAGLYYIYTDGDVPTQMEAWDGSAAATRAIVDRFIGTLPFRLLGRPPDRVMAIGSGGGLDVLLARAAGARSVDAVEINPSIPGIVADERFRHTYARVYRQPGVRLIVDEGRSFLQRAGRYDVIYFACAKTATTQTSGVALLDNHLYTVEAFRDYWRHLSPEGLVALVVQENFLIDRLTLTAVEALRREGLTPEAVAARLVTARVPPALFEFGPYRYILVVRRRAWTPSEAAEIRRAIARTELEPLSVPFARAVGAEGATLDLRQPPAVIREALERQYRIPPDPSDPAPARSVLANLAPVTDDSPFYVDIAPGLHPTVARLLFGAAAATGLVALAALGLGLRAAGREVPWRRKVPATAGAVLYFLALGAGFMLVELALMHRFLPVLGFPTRSLSVTLFALLLSGALGSVASQRGEPADAARRLRGALAALIGLLLIYRLVLPPALEAVLPWPLAGRVLATAALVFPVGFLMGMPFPTALRVASGAMARLIPVFWSVNGAASILGSVATMALAKFAGYGSALLVGAACYLLAALSFRALDGGRG